jgi:hypothetical protein
LAGEEFMAEELGKIEKPPVESFAEGRKLLFIPLVFRGEDSPIDYVALVTKYWEQVEKQIVELASKLGDVNRMYHEMVSLSGEEGCKSIKELNENSHKIIELCLGKKAQLEAVEDGDILSEFMDWSRCLMIGLQNPGVATKVYESYLEAVKKRNEAIAARINETLKENEIGILLMRENHQVQFPQDIQVIYVSPPALDEIKRWLREREAKTGTEDSSGQP